ncbi:MAG: hypothetical protein WBA99_03655 [Nodosilinea sp.]
MKLWLVSFLILFFGAEMAQWLGHLPGLGRIELSLPLTVLGGIGLAIASNYRPWPSLDPNADTAKSVPLPTATPSPSPPAAASPPPRVSRKATDTISFEIKRPQREVDG